MDQISRVYGRSLFEVAQERDVVSEVREQHAYRQHRGEWVREILTRKGRRAAVHRLVDTRATAADGG